MKNLMLTLAAALAFVAGTGTAEGGSTSSSCRSGSTTYEGVRARVYCGPATAVVKLGGRTIRYRGGSCLRNAVAVELGIGTVIMDARDPKGRLPRSFGVSVGRVLGMGKPAPRDGASQSVMVAFVDGGKRYAGVLAKAVLAGNRTRGTFSGRLLTGETVSGSFSCS